MSYWFINKETGEPRVFGSIPVMLRKVPEITDKQKKSIKYQFYNLKKIEFQDDVFRIVRLDVETGGKLKEKADKQ